LHNFHAEADFDKNTRQYNILARYCLAKSDGMKIATKRPGSAASGEAAK
jgi:hypothetical protein